MFLFLLGRELGWNWILNCNFSSLVLACLILLEFSPNAHDLRVSQRFLSRMCLQNLEVTFHGFPFSRTKLSLNLTPAKSVGAVGRKHRIFILWTSRTIGSHSSFSYPCGCPSERKAIKPENSSSMPCPLPSVNFPLIPPCICLLSSDVRKLFCLFS